jgi:mono/diheme cytochrome c family protein
MSRHTALSRHTGSLRRGKFLFGIVALRTALVLFTSLTALVIAAAAGAATPPEVGAPPAVAAPGANKALVARGKYVALAADCHSCHTAPGGQPFAGGAPLKSPLGTFYGSNITPDPDTGIGRWSKADFERALRRGVRKDGAYLYPAMPYGNYTRMSAADMDALWAYLRSVPAVNNTPPENTLPFPFTIRSGIAAWQSLYFRPGPFTPVAGKSAAWNRGAYLVQALGHCDECHTPRNLAQGLEPQHQLAGAEIEGWYAPDISNDSMSKLASYTVEQVAQTLKTGTLPGNAKTVGPMQEVVHDSLRYLTDQDLHAMALYLKDQDTHVTPVKPTPVKYPRLMAGKRVYQDNCMSCHEVNGKGRDSTIPALAGNDAVTASEPYNVIMAILEGFPPQGTWGAMGSFAGTLTDDQIADVANYVRTAWGNNALANATPWSVSDWRKNATAPADESHALLCPNIPPKVLQPALGAGTVALKQAATDHALMSTLVGNYRAAQPDASSADVVEALSTAYCRAVADDHISRARMTAQLSDFANQVALTLGNVQGDSKSPTSVPQ